VSKALTLAELLAQVAGAELSFRREDDLLGVVLLALPAGRQLLIIERVYRDGTEIILDPTPEEVEMARSGDLWKIWNSERPRYLAPEAWEWIGFGE
jgi:hypothetical protein